VVVLMETELWQGFMRQCNQRKIPVLLVNGRISERSFRRYRLVKPFLKSVLKTVSLAVMQTEEDAERLRSLGMKKKKLFVSGSLKFDAGVLPTSSQVTAELQQRFDSPDRPLLLAASTHAPEERLLIDAYRKLRNNTGAEPRLMIAPRHPERFAEVASIMEASGFSWIRRSQKQATGASPPDLILLDTIGELPAAYPLASVVFVGGSIPKHGGHNILEPAAAGCAVVTGANTQNFASIVNAFVEAEAILQLPPLDMWKGEDDLANVFRELLADPQRRETLKQNAQELVTANLGATDRTIKLLAPFLKALDVTKSTELMIATESAHSA
jgi:3-deoxy-D-manno-octulosonic-acid transferase